MMTAPVSNITGIENFTNLEYINCNFNELRDLNISEAKKLSVLNCRNNKINNIMQMSFFRRQVLL